MPDKIDGGGLDTALFGLSLLGIGFYGFGAWRNHSWADWYLIWNLFLAWIPFLLATGLTRFIRHHAWSSWQGIALTLTWLGFLPNSFYMVTDYIHLQDMPRVDIQYDALMFTLFIATSLALGFASLYAVHVQLRDRIRHREAASWVGLVILLCSFAIYLGRELRWNTWDLIINPAGVLFDVSDRLIAPRQHPQSYLMTLTLFAFIGGTYAMLWLATRRLRRPASR